LWFIHTTLSDNGFAMDGLWTPVGVIMDEWMDGWMEGSHYLDETRFGTNQRKR
jgi:hypothetical protein